MKTIPLTTVPLERNTYGGMVDIHGDVCAALKDYAHASVAASGEGSQQVRTAMARRKRRTKTASVDLGQKGRRDTDRGTQILQGSHNSISILSVCRIDYRP